MSRCTFPTVTAPSGEPSRLPCSSAGVTAEWMTESTEVSDASPTIAQPSITLFKGDAYIQASWELIQDAPDLVNEVGRLIVDAKDRLEERPLRGQWVWRRGDDTALPLLPVGAQGTELDGRPAAVPRRSNSYLLPRANPLTDC